MRRSLSHACGASLADLPDGDGSAVALASSPGYCGMAAGSSLLLCPSFVVTGPHAPRARDAVIIGLLGVRTDTPRHTETGGRIDDLAPEAPSAAKTSERGYATTTRRGVGW
jgi:hypothetical protein